MLAISRSKLRILGKICFILYIVFIIYFLIFSDWYGRTGEMAEYHYNLVLFKEIMRFWTYREQVGFLAMFNNLLGNVVIFVPFGFFMPMASKNESVLITTWNGFLLSLLVEVFQLITKVGCFDVDDLLLNTLGGFIGYLLYVAFERRRRKYGTNRKKNSNRGRHGASGAKRT